MKFRQYLLVFGIVVTGLALALSSRPALAANPYCSGLVELNRQGCYGYFGNYDYYKTYIIGSNVLNAPDGKSWAIPASVNDANSFENLIASEVGGGTQWSGNAAAVNRVGAAFIVDAMLGMTGDQAGSCGNDKPVGNGILCAQAHLQEWENDITYEDQQNAIDWGNTNDNWNDTQYQGINTMHTCWPGNPVSDCTLANEDNGSDDGHDIAFFNMQSPEDSHVIYFKDPVTGKVLVRIRRECANLLGNLNPIPSPPPPSANPHCGSDVVDPARIDPETQYSVSSRVWYDTPTQTSLVLASNDNFFVRVTGPGGYSAGSGNVPMTRIGNNTIQGTINPAATGRTGTFTISYGISGSLGAITCSDSFTVTNQPYFTSTGDVEVGAGMTVTTPGGGTTCTAADPKAGVVSWNQEAAGNYAGAGTQYAALALNYLQDFATAQSTASLNPTGLSFSNTNDVNIAGNGNDTYGGALGSEACVPNYYGNPTNIINGSYTVSSSPAIARGSHTYIYVNGDVHINANIVYPDNYSDVNQIPSYTIVANGNIIIGQNVTQLDGLYVAEPNSSGNNGNLYTCDTAPFAVTGLTNSLANYYGNCNNQLTVNGAVVANQLWLLRTGGTLNASPGTPAESFNFSPSLWLTIPPAGGSSGSTGSNGYDSITSLPPTL